MFRRKKVRGHENVSVESLQSKTLKDGYLTKLGGRGMSANWKKRWFVLTDQYLYYFAGPKESTPKGVVTLSQYSTVSETDEKKKPFCLKLHNPNNQSLRVFYCYADNKDEMNDWKLKIMNLYHQQTNKMRETFSVSGKLRLDRSIYLRVADARNLKAMDIGGTSDPYCIIQLGGQQVRTTTIWKSLAPFWGEDYNFTITNPSSDVLSITIFDEDKRTKDEPIGKVTFPIANMDQETHEQWYSLVPENYKQFVSGDVHLKIKYQPHSSSGDGSLTVSVIEARNLASKDSNGFSDPYVVLRFGDEKKKTETIKKTLNPIYNQNFEFKITDSTQGELLLTVWDWDRVGSNEFMGQAKISLEDLPIGQTVDHWYMLVPDLNDAENERVDIEADQEKAKKQTLGEVRLKVKYTEEKILPAEEYAPLLQILEDQQLAVICAFGEVTADREGVAKSLTKLFEARNKSLLLLNTLTTNEIDSTIQAETIFRGNSLATKAIDAYMKLVGLPYLHKVLGPLIRDIYENKKSYEVDPSKAEKSDDISKNVESLKEIVKKFLDAIFNSLDECPIELREIFHYIQKSCLMKWGTDKPTRYTAVSGFIFLRFFGPAILGPKLFDIMKEHPDQRNGRTLVLVAKIVQTLGNLANFGAKEPYMADFNSLINENMENVKSYLDTLCTVPTTKPTKTPLSIDTDKECAYIFHQLLKEKDKLVAVKAFSQDSCVQSLPSILSNLETQEKKFTLAAK